MKLNMLSLVISSQYANKASQSTSAADIAALQDADDGRLKIRERVEQSPMVKFITIAGQAIELTPAMILKEGPVSRTIRTPGYIHTLEISIDFATGVVYSSLKSVFESTGEEIDLGGSWQITYVTTNYTCPKRRKSEAASATDWLEEHRKVMKETGGRYATEVINYVR
jgi:hypothetical protein